LPYYHVAYPAVEESAQYDRANKHQYHHPAGTAVAVGIKTVMDEGYQVAMPRKATGVAMGDGNRHLLLHGNNRVFVMRDWIESCWVWMAFGLRYINIYYIRVGVTV
jgi:hypothetical protein